MNTWKIDPNHSEIKFKVRHLVVSTVTGHFGKFEGTIQTENDNFENAIITFEADIDSINTNNEMRDGHLKSADFFDAASHPKLKFLSKSFKRISDNEYELAGDITMRGITKGIKLKTIYNGTVKGMDGSDVAGFELTGKLSRMEFGLTWNALTEAGGVAVSDEIKLDINIEATKAKSDAETETKAEAKTETKAAAAK